MSGDGLVYFLRPVGAEGPVKIGSTRGAMYAAQARLALYQSWSPVELEIAAGLVGGLKLERRFHAKFRHLHTHHEWFRADPELTATIDAIRDRSFDVTTLPRGRALWASSLTLTLGD